MPSPPPKSPYLTAGDDSPRGAGCVAYRLRGSTLGPYAFVLMSTWSPSTWHERPAGQQPDWPDVAALDRPQKQLGTSPPLVFAGEASSLTAELARVARGEAFLLQAGDCAESFDAF